MAPKRKPSKAKTKAKTKATTPIPTPNAGDGIARGKGTQRGFLAAYCITGSITKAAEMAGVTRRTHYDWLDHDAAYPELFAEAEEIAADYLESEARRRAIDGVKRMRFHQGKPIMDPTTGEPYVEHEYSDTLLIFLLKAIRPTKFRDNSSLYIDGKLKHTGDAATPVQHMHRIEENLSDEQRVARVADLLRRARERTGNAAASNTGGNSGTTPTDSTSPKI